MKQRWKPVKTAKRTGLAPGICCWAPWALNFIPPQKALTQNTFKKLLQRERVMQKKKKRSNVLEMMQSIEKKASTKIWKLPGFIFQQEASGKKSKPPPRYKNPPPHIQAGFQDPRGIKTLEGDFNIFGGQTFLGGQYKLRLPSNTMPNFCCGPTIFPKKSNFYPKWRILVKKNCYIHQQFSAFSWMALSPGFISAEGGTLNLGSKAKPPPGSSYLGWLLGLII